MKVGTDGVLLGAWTPVEHAMTILDVGTGTGLIALMLAQRQPEAVITAIDIEAAACEEAAANFKASSWSQRLAVILSSLQAFSLTTATKFDLIVSNPPYFSRSLQAPCERRTNARHDETLNVSDLIHCSKRLLNDKGHLAVILPVIQYEKFLMIASEQGFYEKRNMKVHPNPDKPVKRIMTMWGLDPQEATSSEHLVIEDTGRHQYTAAYMALTRDFYLNFP